MVSENTPVDCKNWCWNWHWSRSKLHLRDLLTLASFYLLAWFCCLPPPATTSGKWRNSGHRLVWLPTKWSSGTHATAQWWVLPTRQFWDSLVESSRQEWVRRVCGYCPAFEGRKHRGDLSCFSQHDHCTQRKREHRQKEEEGRKYFLNLGTILTQTGCALWVWKVGLCMVLSNWKSWNNGKSLMVLLGSCEGWGKALWQANFPQSCMEGVKFFRQETKDSMMTI